MNTKSTENLIESEDSIEELFAPSSNPKGKKTSNSDKNDSENGEINRIHVAKQGNFLVEKIELESKSRPSTSKPPVPAVRKLSLPPIASQRNGKELKESSNQLTQRLSLQSDDTIHILNERRQRQAKHIPDSESDSDIQEKPSFRRQRKDKIELIARTKDKQMNVKKLFASSEGNEETTSFISYEEKHEKEDNSERSPSNRTSTNSNLSNIGAGGKTNEAFVHDDIAQDQENEGEKPNRQKQTEEIEEFPEKHHKTKSKKKSKRVKSTKMSREKRKKPSSRETEQSADQIESIEHVETSPQVYDFKKVIGKQH